METIKIGAVTCIVRRSKRRTVGFKVGTDAMPIIFSPAKMSLDRLTKICLPYERQIIEMADRQRELNKRRESFVLTYGMAVRVLGATRILRAGRGRTVGYDGEAFYIPAGRDENGIRIAAVKAYKLFAAEYISKRVLEISRTMGIEAPPVKINSAKTHWATCSKAPSLNFSWYTVMASPEAVDYIIIHELCHLKYFNHSDKFWAEVNKYCTDYKRHKVYLKNLWQEIAREKWD